MSLYAGYRIKVGDVKNEPKEFATALRNCTEEDSRGGIRYRFLVKNLLNEDTKEIIEEATSALDIWIKLVETLQLSEERVEMSRFEKKLYYSTAEEEIDRVTDPEYLQESDLTQEQSQGK